ncbi:hypothetical protein U8335_22645 [Roseiconus lacunae]|nr:hypothetical protein U8335_22645 [Stieleria sp. HD01]
MALATVAQQQPTRTSVGESITLGMVLYVVLGVIAFSTGSPDQF